MKKAELTKVAASVLKPRGYEFASGRFIKHDSEMVAVIEFQKNDFSNGIYTNVGAGPLNTSYSIPPKDASHCGLQVRAVRLPIGTAARTLARLESDTHPSIEEIERAITGLAAWVDAHLMDPSALRLSLLNPRSQVRRYGLIMRTLKRWAGLDEDA